MSHALLYNKYFTPGDFAGNTLGKKLSVFLYFLNTPTYTTPR